MHVARIVTRYRTRDGEQREYVSHLLRRSVRDGRRVRHEDLANLSALPPEAIEAVRAVLAGRTLVAAGDGFEILRSLPHGNVAAVAAAARGLGLPGLLGPAGPQRDLAFALIVSRIVRPASKLATHRWWADTTLAVDLGVAAASRDEVYAALDWLLSRQDAIETELAGRYLSAQANPSRQALFDLSSSWVTGSCCPLAGYGYSRDGHRGDPQIEYGLLAAPGGRPIAVKVFAGNTADPTAFVQIVDRVRDTFGLTRLVMVGDRGMITSARIDALRGQPGMGWITALRAPAITALAADGGPLQLSLFDQMNLAEITHPDYPGERLVACRNPVLAAERARKRAALLAATEADLAKVAAQVTAGRLRKAGPIGVRVGKVVGKHKMEKHFTLTIADRQFGYTRDQAAIDTEAALDGIYVIRTSEPADALDTAAVVTSYKDLTTVERDFWSMKTVDLDIRPVRHYTEDRVRAHVFLCMLAEHVLWALRRAWAPLTYTDQTPPQHADPVAPARRSTHAAAKAASHTNPTDQLPLYTLRGLLDHLATLTRNTIRLTGSPVTFDQLTLPTPTQQRAFQLLDTTIPLHLQ
jgi:hypothetical protein